MLFRSPLIEVDLPVLIVENNAANVRVLQKMLASYNILSQALPSTNGLLDLLRTKKFQFILLSATLPDFPDFAEQDLSHIPPQHIIIMRTTTEIPKRHSWVAGYIMKPIIESDLLIAITRHPMDTPASRQILPGPETHHCAKILLAEDNPVNQKVAMRILEKLGHSVVLVENGLQAVAAVQDQTFDLVLMDVQMPEMGGFEATAKIRQLERRLGRHTPIIAMTAHALDGDRERCIDAGMEDYVSKPIKVDQLKMIIDMFISQSCHAFSAETPVDKEGGKHEVLC